MKTKNNVFTIFTKITISALFFSATILSSFFSCATLHLLLLSLTLLSFYLFSFFHLLQIAFEEACNQLHVYIYLNEYFKLGGKTSDATRMNLICVHALLCIFLHSEMHTHLTLMMLSAISECYFISFSLEKC